MAGQINSALRYLTENDGGGVLPLSDDVMAQLIEKTKVHRRPVSDLCFSGQSKMSQTQFTKIKLYGNCTEIVRNAALRIKGFGGPQAMRMSSGEFLHQSHSIYLEQTCAQQ